MALYDPMDEPLVLRRDETPDLVAARKLLPKLEMRQIQNLWKLATYLRSLPEYYQNFTMATFHMDPNSEWSAYANRALGIQSKCGSVACAVGHAPDAGIGSEEELRMSWGSYAFSVFGLEGNDWAWCFSEAWASIDNTPTGAAARIHYLLDSEELPEYPDSSGDEGAFITMRHKYEPYR